MCRSVGTKSVITVVSKLNGTSVLQLKELRDPLENQWTDTVWKTSHLTFWDDFILHCSADLFLLDIKSRWNKTVEKWLNRTVKKIIWMLYSFGKRSPDHSYHPGVVHIPSPIKYRSQSRPLLWDGRQRAVALSIHCYNALVSLLSHSINAGNDRLNQFILFFYILQLSHRAVKLHDNAA